MNPDAVMGLRKAIIRLSMATHTGIDYYMGLKLVELIETMKEVAEVGNERVRASDKNRRKNR